MWPSSARRAVLLGIATAVTVLWMPASAQDAAKYRLKPGASGKACLACHVEFEDTIKAPHVHTPVKAGNCADCHDPHASDHGKLLEAEPDAICLSCHEDTVPPNAVSAHPDAAAGRCVQCHDPHASQFPKQLRASGNELCVRCHAGVTEAVRTAAYKHVPATSDCLGCHRPHASEKSPFLLANGVPGLCLDCHDPQRPQFVKDHLGYPVADANCASCHDPHGSANKGILWTTVHEPVGRGMCAQCHSAADGPQALALQREGADLCAGCHNALVNETALAARIHWPVVDRRACANCHTPHASKNTGLLAEPQGTLCASCHIDSVRRSERSLVKHPPIIDGECSTCHEPHGADTTYLLAASNTMELCGNCHEWESHSTHPIGEKVKDLRNPNLSVDCLSCHRTHGTSNDKLAFYDPDRELCTECHSGFQR